MALPLVLLTVIVAASTILSPVHSSVTTEEAIQMVIDQVDTDRIEQFITDYTVWPRNTQSKWMKSKEESLKQAFRSFGMDVVTKKYNVYQCFPKDVDPSVTYLLGEGDVVLETYREDGDPAKKILPAFNAWSESGTVEGIPVYVNYGRKKDFEKLLDLGYNLTDTIGIARYGKLYRGDKAKFAKEFGLKGLIIYMDAADYCPEGVNAMPDGPGLPETGIQRGALKDADGDPSTYLYPSTKYAYHAPEEEYKKMLPGIITMPINFKNALPLLRDLDGEEVFRSDDGNENWQGAGSDEVPTYRYGPGFREESRFKKLRITVNLEYKLVEIEDIFGVIRGAQEPDRWVMIGNHRDTWVNGAVDATTGLSVLNELGHGLKKLREEQNWKPRRTIVLASWGAEEQGIIGSTEFVEDYLTLLQEKMVAYINVDVAASGNLKFSPSATPNFRPLLDRSTKRAQPSHDKYATGTFYDQWRAVSGGDESKMLSSLGSGSDYASFIGQAGVSSIDLTIKGSYYPYHTEYDNIDYLAKFADPGMMATRSVAEIAAGILLELACERLVPLDANAYTSFMNNVIEQSDLETDLETNNVDFSLLSRALEQFTKNAAAYESSRSRYENTKRYNAMDVRRFNDKMLIMERSFIVPQGLPGRPHKRHMLFAPSVLDSYSGSILPGLYDAVSIAKEDSTEENWNAVRKQLTIATWVIKAASRALASEPFPR